MMKKDLFEHVWYSLRHSVSDALWWVRYRTTHRNHYIWTGLPPGYYDKDEVLLRVNFQLMVDYVEVELAWMQVIFDKEAAEEYGAPSRWWKRLSGRSWRSELAGLDYLNWACNLDNPDNGEDEGYREASKSQAEFSRELLLIYAWWKHIRPQRIDPWTQKDTTKAFDIEESYDKEDEEMLCRLMKIRKGLWS